MAVNTKAGLDGVNNIAVADTKKVTATTFKPKITSVESVMIDQGEANFNLIATAFVTLLTVIAITGSNVHAGLSFLLGFMSFLVALQAVKLVGKGIVRFFMDGWNGRKSVKSLWLAFMLSMGVAYINLYEVAKVLGFVETGWFS